jgi:hypothetical protein
MLHAPARRCSANGSWAKDEVNEAPTATQAVAVLQETLLRLALGPAGFGLGSTVQEAALASAAPETPHTPKIVVTRHKARRVHARRI